MPGAHPGVRRCRRRWRLAGRRGERGDHVDEGLVQGELLHGALGVVEVRGDEDALSVRADESDAAVERDGDGDSVPDGLADAERLGRGP